MVAEAEMAWLLDSDPTLRWQVERDLLGAPPEVWEVTRARIANEGFGARLLALQDSGGQWAGGAFFPADFDFHGPEASEDGQPWTATTWTLNSLREWGLDPAVLRERRTAELLTKNSRWDYNNLPYWSGEVDCCINAWTVANGVWLGADITGIVDWFLEHRLPDGGWSVGSSRLSTGGPVGPWVDRFAHPFRWVYNVLNATEYFRQVPLLDGVKPDLRMAEAIELIRTAKQPDGTWLQSCRHPGRVWFEVDAPVGEPSKWLTLLGTRVLAWWASEATSAGAPARRSATADRTGCCAAALGSSTPAVAVSARTRTRPRRASVRVEAPGHHELVESLFVGIGVDGLLADETAHVLGQLGVLDQGQRLVERRDDPPLQRGKRDVQQPDDVRGDRMAGIQCRGTSRKSKCTLRGWIWTGPGSTSRSDRQPDRPSRSIGGLPPTSR